MINKKVCKDFSFYKGKKILVTGHTGFKGSWMCKLLLLLGADVTGYSLQPPTEPSLFFMCGLDKKMNSVIGDIRNLDLLQKTFDSVQPEIVIHMAAQPIVRESYKSPVYTYEVNVMGTVNVLECVRNTPSVQSFLNVTTDKVYHNKEWEWGYRENEELNGFDPYSNSKSCSELVTSCFHNSFFVDRNTAISTARAGNVIGGGDFAEDRIIPDCYRAVSTGKDIIVRNPYSVRPYQHVLEPLFAYLLIAMNQYLDHSFEGNYNVGPEECDCIKTGELVDLFCMKWKKDTNQDVQWVNKFDGGPHEAGYLRLDCAKMKKTFEWKPTWNIEQSIEMVTEWFSGYSQGKDIEKIMEKQINIYIKKFI